MQLSSLEVENRRLKEFLSNSQNHNQHLLEQLRQAAHHNDDLRKQLAIKDQLYSQAQLDNEKLRIQLMGATEEIVILKELARNRDIEVESLQRKVDSLICFSPSRRRNLLNKPPPASKIIRRISNEKDSPEVGKVSTSENGKTSTKPYVSRFTNPSQQPQAFTLIEEDNGEDDTSSISKFGTFQRDHSVESITEMEENSSAQTQNLSDSVFMRKSVTPVDIKRATNTLRRSNLIEDSNVCKFYEGFFIISLNHQDFQKKLETSYSPEIMFAYPEEKVTIELRAQIADFTFPNRVPCMQETKMVLLERQMSQQKTERILKQNILLDQHCHIFTLDPTKASGIKFDNPLIKEANPNQYLFAICVEFEDFIADSKFVPKSPKFWITHQSFLNILQPCWLAQPVFISIASQASFKARRAQLLQQMISSNIFSLKDIDLFYFTQQIGQIQEHLKQINTIKPPDPILNSYPIFNQTQYCISPNLLRTLYLFECCPINILKGWTASQFIQVFTAILTEQKVILLCDKQCQLSYTLLLMIQSIQPLNYPHPLLLSVPETLIPLIEAPIPLILGISNFTDIQTDELVIFRKQTVKLKNSNKISQSRLLQSFEEQLKPYFTKLNAKSVHMDVFFESLKEILSICRNFIVTQILLYLPKFPIYKVNKDYDYESIKARLKSNRVYLDHFLEEFLETQLFQVFIDHHYKDQ